MHDLFLAWPFTGVQTERGRGVERSPSPERERVHPPSRTRDYGGRADLVWRDSLPRGVGKFSAANVQRGYAGYRAAVSANGT